MNIANQTDTNLMRRIFFLLLLVLPAFSASAQAGKEYPVYEVGKGWANNSVNAVVFRKNSIVSYNNFQFISYYDSMGNVILGKRQHGTADWTLVNTQLKGNTRDAHNSISIMVDGKGFLHLAWNQHNNSLNYCRSRAPLSMEMEPRTMIGRTETRVSYPEFYKTTTGDLLFLYRDGESGGGNLVINRYSVKNSSWARVTDNLIDGEGERNAYWQCFLDAQGTFHLSWVWRESPDVSSNHDLCYAKSIDGGLTWQRSNGELYKLPVNAATAEYVCRIPRGSELINQTSMTADATGAPVIAGYWREAADSIPQFHLVYREKDQWKVAVLKFRKTAFTLSGTGTKKIPVSRPQVISWKKGKYLHAALIFRDEERGSKVSMAVTESLSDTARWKLFDLLPLDVGAWEPSYDTERWRTNQQLHLFVQPVVQEDGEGLSVAAPQMVRVLEWKPWEGAVPD